jgi:hypothetical protein
MYKHATLRPGADSRFAVCEMKPTLYYSSEFWKKTEYGISRVYSHRSINCNNFRNIETDIIKQNATVILSEATLKSFLKEVRLCYQDSDHKSLEMESEAFMANTMGFQGAESCLLGEQGSSSDNSTNQRQQVFDTATAYFLSRLLQLIICW